MGALGAPSPSLDNPAAVEARLAQIENQLATKQNQLEDAALIWFKLKKTRERRKAEAFINAQGTVADRTEQAIRATAEVVYATSQGPVDAWEAEGRWEALKASVRVGEARASICMSLLKSQREMG